MGIRFLFISRKCDRGVDSSELHTSEADISDSEKERLLLILPDQRNHSACVIMVMPFEPSDSPRLSVGETEEASDGDQ